MDFGGVARQELTFEIPHLPISSCYQKYYLQKTCVNKKPSWELL